MIHVVIPVFNRVKYTIECLESLSEQVNYKNLNIIVVDDGSTDGTSKILKQKFPEIQILQGTGSLFWCGAISLGIKFALEIGNKNDFVLLLNNDVRLSANAIINLTNVLVRYDRKAIAGALSVNIKDKKTIIKSGTIVRSWFWNSTHHLYNGQKLNNINSYEPRAVDVLTGRCLLHPIEIFNKIGNYDNKTFRHYGGDDEFSRRVVKLGYSVLLCPKSIVYLREENPYKNVSIFKFFFHMFFGIRSNQNIFTKFNLTKKVVPIYARPTYFIIALLKSFYVTLKVFFKK